MACDLDISAFNDGVLEQIPLLRLELIRYMTEEGPYLNTVTGGTMPSRAGDTIRTVLPGRVVTNQSMTRPVFSDSIEACGTVGVAAEWGQTIFDSTMQILRGESPLVCLRLARASVMDSYRAAVLGMQDGITELNEADVRANYLDNSGFKARILSSGNLGDMTSGGENQVAVNFPGGLPTSPISHQFVTVLYNFVRNNFANEQFGSGSAGRYAILAASNEALETLRNEAGVKQDLLAITQGSFTEGKDIIKKYAFVQYPYRGIMTLEDQKPLRFNSVDGTGAPVLIEPYVRTATDKGFINLTNPDWVDAAYEVAFLIFKDSFKRIVPEMWRGEDAVRFPAQSVMGELKWIIPQDFQCNKWQDYGQFLYQFERAYKPVRPWTVVPILYKRCQISLGTSECTGLSE